MSKSNLKSALQFLFLNNWKSLAISFGIITGIFLLIAILLSSGVVSVKVVESDQEILLDDKDIDLDIDSAKLVVGGNDKLNLSILPSIAIAYIITLFVLGCTTIRNYLRYFIQNGLGRKTLIATQSIFGVSLSVLVTLLSYFCYLIVCLITQKQIEFFSKGGLFSNIPGSMLLIFLLAFVIYNLGGFISISIYRMNRIWTIISCIGVPLIIINFEWIVALLFPGVLDAITGFCLFSGLPRICITIVIANLLLLVPTVLMTLRAPVKPATN